MGEKLSRHVTLPWEGREDRAGRAPPQSHSKGNLVVAEVVRLNIFGVSQRLLHAIG